MKEAALVRQILAYLAGLPHCYAQKRTPSFTYGHRGNPDIYGSIKGRHFEGRHFELEVKVPGKKPTLLQAMMLERWRHAGAVTGVVSSVGDVAALFKRARLL